MLATRAAAPSRRASSAAWNSARLHALGLTLALLAGICRSVPAVAEGTSDEASPPAATAAQQEAVDGAAGISVESRRDPALMPYRKGYDLIKRIQTVAGPHVQLYFRAIGARDDKPVPNLRITIEGNRLYGQVAVDDNGFFTVPLNDEAYHDGADFVTNQARGSLKVGLILEPQLPADDLSTGLFSDSTAAARRAIREVIPWYLRWLLPSVRGAGLCYRQSGHTVRLGPDHEPRQADFADSDRFGQKVWCAYFRDGDPALSSDVQIDPDPGWQAEYTASYF